jgi:membrane protease YdiL (CAAX protease family)
MPVSRPHPAWAAHAPGRVASVSSAPALFGLFHLDLYRLIPTTILGVLLGFLALESGSIVPSMVAHFCNNAMLITLASLHLDRQMETLGHRALTLVVVASLTLTAAGLALVRGAGHKPEV